MKTLVWVVILVLLIVGGYWFIQQGGLKTVTVEEGMGTYPYVCDNGMEFTMSPSADVTIITLTPGTGASFGETTLAHTDSTAGARFEGGNPADGSIVFFGAGEGVRLTVGGSTFICNPVPNPDSPPWNWGDAGEGAGDGQDLTAAVSANITGKWRSVDDAKFTREFRSDGTAVDAYEGTDKTSGTWKAFTKEAPLPVPFPLEDNTVYIQMTMAGTQADTLNFKLAKLTLEELELIYMDRGGTLRFRSIE